MPTIICVLSAKFSFPTQDATIVPVPGIRILSTKQIYAHKLATSGTSETSSQARISSSEIVKAAVRTYVNPFLRSFVVREKAASFGFGAARLYRSYDISKMFKFTIRTI